MSRRTLRPSSIHTHRFWLVSTSGGGGSFINHEHRDGEAPHSHDFTVAEVSEAILHRARKKGGA